MPLRLGAAYKDGPRSLLVTDLQYRSERCTVTFRTSSVSVFTEALSRPMLIARFRHRGLVLDDSPRNGRSYHLSIGSVSAGGGAFLFTASPHLTQQIDIDYRVAQPVYPIYEEQRATGPPCEEIDIAFERTTYAGSLTRTLELHDFYLNEHPGQTRSARQWAPPPRDRELLGQPRMLTGLIQELKAGR